MISPGQIRAARALLGWKQAELAEAAGLSEISVKNIERGATDPRGSTLAAIIDAVQGGGVQFIDGDRPGVQWHGWRWFIERYEVTGTKAQRAYYFPDFDSMLKRLRTLKKEFPTPDYVLRVHAPAVATDDERKAIKREGFELAF